MIRFCLMCSTNSSFSLYLYLSLLSLHFYTLFFHTLCSLCLSFCANVDQWLNAARVLCPGACAPKKRLFELCYHRFIDGQRQKFRADCSTVVRVTVIQPPLGIVSCVNSIRSPRLFCAASLRIRISERRRHDPVTTVFPCAIAFAKSVRRIYL